MATDRLTSNICSSVTRLNTFPTRSPDPNAQVRWMQVATNIDIERMAVLPRDCPGDDPVVNDFHASESRFMNCYGYAAYVADHMKQPGMMPIVNIPNTEATYATEVRLQDTGQLVCRIGRHWRAEFPPICARLESTSLYD